MSKKYGKNTGPIPDPLRQDPLAEADKPSVVLNEEVSVVPIIKPIAIEHIDLPGIKSEAVEEMKDMPIAPTIKGEDISFSEGLDVTLFTHKPQARVVVIGLDNRVSSSVRVFIQKLGLQTFNAVEERRRGETLIEQFNINNNQFDFAVAVLTRDQRVVLGAQSLEQAEFVCRQETVFELGFLVGKLGRAKVAVFYEEENAIKRPTQYFDLLYTPFDTNGHWQKRLLNQLLSAGLIREAALV